MQSNKPEAGRVLQILIIALISFVVYFNALPNGFVYDDKEQVVENLWIRDVGSIPEIFSQSVWGFAKEVEDQGTANYYRPLMHLVYMANYLLFGLKPWGFHLVNILIHAGVSVMVFVIISKLLGEVTPTLTPAYRPGRLPPQGGGEKKAAMSKNGWGGRTQGSPLHNSRFTIHDSRFPAFIAAVLFATHPIHTEAVTWVASLPEVAFTFFYLLSFYFYMRYREGEGIEQRAYAFYILSLASFAISLFFKEPALTLPVILIVYDLAFHNSPQPPLNLRGGAGGGGVILRRGLWIFLRRYLPYFVIAGIYLLLRLNALKSMVPTETFKGLSFYQSVINVFPLFMEYLKDLLFPFDLKFWHPFKPLETLLNTEGLLSLAVSVAFAAAMIVSWKRNKMIFLGLLLIIVPLLPAFYIKGIGSKPYAERYLYLPSLGFVVLLAVFLFRLRQKTPRYGLAAAMAGLVLAGAYSAQTIIRNPVWKDDFTFYADTIKKAPDAVPLRIAYGVALAGSGRLDEAIEQYQTAIRLGPEYWQAYENLGIAYGRQGLLDKAIEELKTALKLNPKSAVTYSNLGNAYMRKGSIDEAIEQLRISLQLNPDFYAAHFNLGNAYEQKGVIDKAIEEYQAAVRLKPDYDEAHYLLGRAYANSGRLDEAIKQFRTLVSLRPDNPSYHNTLGALYGQKGLFDQAVEEFGAAVRLAPDKPSYRENLERAKGQKSKQ